MDTMAPPVHESVAEHREAVAEAYRNLDAIRHFKAHSHKAPNWQRNIKGPWLGLPLNERLADIETADWVPNRAAWRARGFRNQAHAQAVLGA